MVPWYVTRSPFVKHVETKYHITIFYLAPNSIDMNDMIHTSMKIKLTDDILITKRNIICVIINSLIMNVY